MAFVVRVPVVVRHKAEGVVLRHCFGVITHELCGMIWSVTEGWKYNCQLTFDGIPESRNRLDVLVQR